MNAPTNQPGGPLLDTCGKAIVAGKDAAGYLWHQPDDADTRAKILQFLTEIKAESLKAGRHEMPSLCDQMLTAANASPSPQQVEILVDGFDRLYKLWGAAKSGLLTNEFRPEDLPELPS